MGNLSFVSATFILGVLMLMPFFFMDLMSSSESLKFTTSSTLQFIYIGVGPSIISYYLWSKAIVEIGSTKAATIYNTLPIFSALFAALFLNERVLAVQIVSSAIIVAGVLLVLLGKRNKYVQWKSTTLVAAVLQKEKPLPLLEIFCNKQNLINLLVKNQRLLVSDQQ